VSNKLENLAILALFGLVDCFFVVFVLVVSGSFYSFSASMLLVAWTGRASSSSSSETICSALFTDKIRTAVHYIVSNKLTIKSSVKKVCFEPALETVQSRCSSCGREFHDVGPAYHANEN